MSWLAGIVGYNVFENRPKLTAWYNRVKEFLQPEYTEASAVLEKVKSMYSNGADGPPSKL